MTRSARRTSALAAVLASLVMLVGLLSGHCPRPVLDPHPIAAAAAVTAAAAEPAGTSARPADHSCTTQTPAALATPATTPVDPPQPALAATRSLDVGAPAPLGAAASSRAPPPRIPSAIDLCVLRV
jgi:hypothetical protein